MIITPRSLVNELLLNIFRLHTVSVAKDISEYGLGMACEKGFEEDE